MSRTVADLLVGTLQQIGVKHIFGLIGNSLNPIADAVRRSDIEWIGVRHEEGAALAAAGQAKLTGRLSVCAGTTGPGSTHLVAGLYEASRDHAPVLALSGDMPRKMHGTDFIQTTEPDLLFRDVSLYTETVSSPAQAPAVIHQAISAAYAGRGVAHLTLPQDIIAAAADGALSSVATLKPKAELAASAADISEISRRIDAAGSVVIMCGAGCQGAADELRALSDRLKAPLIHSVKGKDIMPYDDPRWMGGIGMIGTKAVYNAVMHCDLLLMLGTDYPYVEFLPHKGSVIQLDDRARVLGRRAPTALGALGAVRPTLKLLLDKVAAKDDGWFCDRVTRERRKWDEMLDRQADPSRSADRVHPQAVARAVSDLAARDAVFVLDTGLNTLWSANWIRQSGAQRIIGSFNNAAVGTALGQSNGIQALDRARQVIALCGDGGFNMLMCGIPDRRTSRAAGQGDRLQQFGVRADQFGGRIGRVGAFRQGYRISKSGFHGIRARLRRTRVQGGETWRPARRHQGSVRGRRPGHCRLRRQRRGNAQFSASRARENRQLRDRKDQRSGTCGHWTVGTRRWNAPLRAQ